MYFIWHGELTLERTGSTWYPPPLVNFSLTIINGKTHLKIALVYCSLTSHRDVKTASKYISGAMSNFLLEIITSAILLYFIAERCRRDIFLRRRRPSVGIPVISATVTVLHCLLLLCLTHSSLTISLYV